ncbi:alpha/beta fold hydrolase [Actinoplanes sp. CA-051413]|uniref:alpha/beta fold hydrolase n=1 Tax=Actinoplanes sp. CA-051413 TaxID=3239899 RepID=UPI003D957DE3
MPTYSGADATPLSYDDTGGDGPPLVTLAGGSGRHPAYLGDLAGLGRHRRLITPHLRGVGRSPLPADVTVGSFWQQAADLERLRRHLGVERLRLLGHSAGTRLAVSYAARYPERVGCLVLVTPPVTWLLDVASDTDQVSERRRGDPLFEAALAASRQGLTRRDDEGFNDFMTRVAPLGYATWGPAEQAHAVLGRFSYAANRAWPSVDPPADLARRLAAVTAPVLVIAGAEDAITGCAPAVALTKLFGDGTAEVLDRCGHYPWVEQPQAFRRAVDEFLDARVKE